MSSSSGGTALSRPTDINPQQIQKLLDENAQLIKALVEAQNIKGKSMDVIQYQQILHRNLVYLAGLADPRVDIHTILPPPGSSNLLQSQRAPPPNQSISSTPQNMTTPPPSSMSMSSSPLPPTSSMPRPPPPNATVGGGQMMGGAPPQWVGTTPSTISQQQMQMAGGGQYTMKGYAPSPWLAQAQSPGNYTANMQQRMQLDRRQQLLRLHQERLIRAQQVRQMQQQTSQPLSLPPQPGGMYPGQGGTTGGYMGSGPQVPPSTMYGQPIMPPVPSNMPQLDM